MTKDELIQRLQELLTNLKEQMNREMTNLPTKRIKYNIKSFRWYRISGMHPNDTTPKENLLGNLDIEGAATIINMYISEIEKFYDNEIWRANTIPAIMENANTFNLKFLIEKNKNDV